MNKEEEEVIKRMFNKQKHSNKDEVTNALELLKEINIIKRKKKTEAQKKIDQTKWNMDYQKNSEKYKEYKRKYMIEYYLKKKKTLGDEFIDMKIKKAYNDNDISKNQYIKIEKKHLNNKEILDSIDKIKDYRNMFIVFYGDKNYKKYILNI